MTVRSKDTLLNTTRAALGVVNGAGDGSADDTATIQAALTAAATNGGTVRGIPGRNYLISSALVIGSNTTLDMTGCTITLASSQTSSSIMLIDSGHSALLASQPWVAPSRIAVRGGVWQRGSVAAGSGNTLHIMILGGDQVTVQNVTITSGIGKYALLLQNSSNFRVRDCHFVTASDGVHVNGPASNGFITGITGTTGDDLVAIMPYDYTAYVWGNESDITNMVIDGVQGTSSTNLVKVLSGFKSGVLNTKAIKIRNVAGVVPSGGVSGVYVGDDTSSGNTTGGQLDDILIDGVSATVPSNSPVVTVPGNSSSLVIPTVTVRNVTVKSDCSGIVNVTGKVGALLVDGVRGSTATAAPTSLLWINQGASTAQVSRANVTNCDVTFAVAGGSLCRASLNSHTLSELQITSVTGTNVGQLFDLATVTAVRFRDVRLIGNTVTANVRASASITLFDGHGTQCDNQSWTTVATRTDTATVTSGSSTISDTSIVGGDAGKLVVGTGIPAASFVGAVTAGASFTLVNASGSLVNATAPGASVTLGSQIASKGLGVAIGLDKLPSKTRGDMATNTNAGIAGGVGPCVYGSSSWLNLSTATVSGTF